MKNKTAVAYLACIALIPWSLQAQDSSKSRLRFELSLDYNSFEFMTATQLLYADFSELIVAQNETASVSVSASRMITLSDGFSARYGVSLSDIGYVENSTFIHLTSGTILKWKERVNMVYAGVPVALGYNTGRLPKSVGFCFEAGAIAHVLLYHSGSSYSFMDVDLRRAAFSGFANLGVKVRLDSDKFLVIAPQVRMGLMNYDRGQRSEPGSLRGYRPIGTSISASIIF